MSVWVVTGGAGFLGGHVLAALGRTQPTDSRIVALGRRLPDKWPPERFLHCELDDATRLRQVLEPLSPDYVIHAAGRTPPATASAFYRDNTRATIELLRAVSELGRRPRVVIIGSAAELGPVPVDALPVGESHPARPIGPYALSKWSATTAGLRAPWDLEVVAARIFNPIGPGMAANQAFGRFALLLAAGGRGPLTLRVGDLASRRDFIDVRDVADAVVALALRGRNRTLYHVGTGRSHSVGEGLERLVELSGRPVELETAPGPAGSGSGPTDSRADISRIAHDVGWLPRIPFLASLADLWSEVGSRASADVQPRHVA